MSGPCQALSLRVRGVVQGVGFRPFIFRLAQGHGVSGWVLNAADGVLIHAEGSRLAVEAFARELRTSAPPPACVADIEVRPARVAGFDRFEIRDSARRERPTVRVSPDLPVCDACVGELFDPGNRRYRYPYITCAGCGPRFSIITELPYDRPNTTLAGWAMCRDCRREYEDPADRRFHAQPLACPACGPQYVLRPSGAEPPIATGDAAIREAARLLGGGHIVALKGIGGYHLACHACDARAVMALRERKYRKEKPFAIMARSLGVAQRLVALSAIAEGLIESPARPIVLARARQFLPGVAPDNPDLGVMLPYAPLHHLLFASGAPEALVLTSANRSSEPIAYEEADAYERLAGMADAFLVGERPIARRVDDSVTRDGEGGPVVLRRARGYAPGAVASLPAAAPIVAVGADLKNTVTVVVNGQAFVSQHLGDLDGYAEARAFRETIADLTAMYDIDLAGAVIAHDAHPQYVSTAFARTLPSARTVAVQHHRAHIASVMAEHGEIDTPCLGVAFDGTGYGDDGSIWGGEVLAGSVTRGFTRVAHLRPAVLAGGDAAARHPVQAAAGFVAAIGEAGDLANAPFNFPRRFQQARQLIERGVRSVRTTSVGRLFDAASALLGFTRPMTFEGQAAIWLEHLAQRSTGGDHLPFAVTGWEIDWHPAIQALIDRRRRGEDPAALARAFHRGLARATATIVRSACETHHLRTVALSGGVFQNQLLSGDLRGALASTPGLRILTTRNVPPNDGGISVGQAALACCVPLTPRH